MTERKNTMFCGAVQCPVCKAKGYIVERQVIDDNVVYAYKCIYCKWKKIEILGKDGK